MKERPVVSDREEVMCVSRDGTVLTLSSPSCPAGAPAVALGGQTQAAPGSGTGDVPAKRKKGKPNPKPSEPAQQAQPSKPDPDPVEPVEFLRAVLNKDDEGQQAAVSRPQLLDMLETQMRVRLKELEITGGSGRGKWHSLRDVALGMMVCAGVLVSGGEC
jgi:hypothetical protein